RGGHARPLRRQCSRRTRPGNPKAYEHWRTRLTTGRRRRRQPRRGESFGSLTCLRRFKGTCGAPVCHRGAAAAASPWRPTRASRHDGAVIPPPLAVLLPVTLLLVLAGGSFLLVVIYR